MPATRCKLSGRSDRRTLGSVFERFTEAARRVVVLSQEEARLLNHNYIGTEHILLALVGQDDTVAAPALRRSGITPRSARAEVETVIGLGTSAPSGHIPFTPRAKKVLELSLREAQRLGDVLRSFGSELELRTGAQLQVAVDAGNRHRDRM